MLINQTLSTLVFTNFTGVGGVFEEFRVWVGGKYRNAPLMFFCEKGVGGIFWRKYD